jgi:hypothetical protein
MLVQIALKNFVYPLNCRLKDFKPYIYIYICEQIISVSLKVAGIYKDEYRRSVSFKIS